MPATRLELVSPKASDFKSDVYTNSTKQAYLEHRARFELANNGFAIRPLRPLGHLRFVLADEVYSMGIDFVNQLGNQNKL